MSNGFEEYVSEAQSLAAGGDTEGAIEMYKAALTENPTSEEVHREIINLTLEKHDFQQVIVEYFDWAEACQVDGEIDDAIRIYQEILELDSILHSKMEGYDPESVQEAISQIQEIIESASGAIFFNMGYLYMEKNSLDEAVSSLQKSLEYNASDAKTHALLGQVFMQKELDKEAIGEFQEVVRLAPDEAAYAYEMLGEIFIRSGKPPQSTVVWFRNAGDLYVRHQQYEEAIRAYERILSFEPDNKDVILRLGEIHAEQGNSQRAFEIYRDLAEIYKNDGLLDKVIGVYEKLLEWDPENTEARQKIIEIYQKILEMDPSNLSARSKLISNILRKGNPEEAVPEFLALSKTYLEKGMRKEAFAVCKKLLELDPKNEKAHELIADIFYDQGAKDKALPEYLMVIKLYQEQNDEEELNRINEKVNKRFPGTKEVTYKLAQAYVEKGEYDLALAEYQKVLNQEPANLDILTAMLEILEKKEDNENVIKFAERIITLAPSRTGIQEKIIKIYEKSGNNEKLLDYYRKILENEPERNDIRDKILDIYERTSKTDEALSLYKEILEADPERVDVRQKMIEHYASAGEIEKVLSQSSALADIFLNSEDFDKAEGLYKNVLAFMPGDVTIRERLCNIYKARDEEEKVKEELLVLANVNSRENKLGSSIEYCRNILEYNPDDLSIKLRIADNASKMGDTDQAVEQFKEVANIYIDKKMTQPAIVTIENILEVDEQNVVYRQKLITILKDQLRIEETIRHYKILIQHFLRMKQNDEAIIAAKDAIALLPMDLELRRDLVELFLEEDDVENGRAFSEELINLHLDRSEYQEVIDIHQRISQIYKDKEDLGTYFEYREKIAQVYEKQAKFHDAINEYIAILEGNLETSNTAEAQRLFPVIIDLYLKEERPSEAVDCFREISRKLHDSNKVEEAILVLEQMVGIEKRIEKFDSALEVLSEIIKYYDELEDLDKMRETYHRRMDIFLQDKNIPRAIDEMFEVIKLNLRHDDLEAAMGQFAEVEKFEPESPDQYFRMGEVLFDLDILEEARKLYLRVLDFDPGNFEAVARIAIIFAKVGKLNEAVEYTRKIFSKGLLAEVIEAYKESSLESEDKAQIHMNLGLFYQEMGFIEEAILEFQEAAKDPEKLLEAYNLMALCFKKEGFMDLAVRQFERALEQPGYTEESYLLIRYNLAETLMEDGKYEEALSAFYECYMVDINYKDISEKIAYLNEKLSDDDNQEEE